MMTSLRYRWTQLFHSCIRGPFRAPEQLKVSYQQHCGCVFCSSRCRAALPQPQCCWMRPLVYVHTLPRPIVGTLVIRIRTHLLLRPYKGYTNGDEVSWGHIKASHTPGWTVKQHQRDGVTRFLRFSLLLLSARMREGLPDCNSGLGRSLHKHTCIITKSSLTWDIDYFFVHVQEGGLCFFTPLTQGIDLQGGKIKRNC